MITAKRQEDGSYQLTNGNMRLRVLMEATGKAEVMDTDTGETIHVHNVDGKWMALSEDSQANIEDAANAAINRARG